MVAVAVLIMIANVMAGVQTRCMVATGATSAGLATACSTMTIGAAAPGCVTGAVILGTSVASICHDLGTKNIRKRQHPEQYEKEAYCIDFGPEYGYECIKPRHLKQLGDISIQYTCTPDYKEPSHHCIGDKFYASCTDGKWIPMICPRGQVCSQTTSNTITCSAI
jgi:hypothetical protein